MRESMAYREATVSNEGHRNPMTLPELEARLRRWLQGRDTAIVFELQQVPVAYALYRVERVGSYLWHFLVDREQERPP